MEETAGNTVSNYLKVAVYYLSLWTSDVTVPENPLELIHRLRHSCKTESTLDHEKVVFLGLYLSEVICSRDTDTRYNAMGRVSLIKAEEPLMH